ncbi:glycosyltransferase family 9 protein [Prescottella equi]|uniref:Glycosyltransferase family 9 protein n=2 Tax=Rhodococcus hoagii TaxID=43767 RepID=A0A9Q2UYM5_RHOHA|nr:glycosyltransferase family 9 protein [Prescottella equi]MBM4488757.1 glycosyltransferase family 9 protein [Prescottella equi]MBM4503839.1 glycosyltransferase family 9 protein [Prescottella equi]MBM4517334.1 glycosyltransferase family 9 protein [Prescottella equi]MBM4553196.1 glycosyltransferase family 9 protein [Prescottella equi]MBM4570058.1 glycosyltransferase family 9 protein [Prescottella equi]
MTGLHTLVVRQDNLGDVLLAGPCVRAVAAGSGRVTLLVGPRGSAAAALLPDVDEVLVWEAPWIDPEPVWPGSDSVLDLVDRLRRRRFDRALILTSFHQSPLPTAVLLRMAGVPWIAAISDDYPGALLDVRHRLDSDVPEAERALDLARRAGFQLPRGDDGRLRLRAELPDPAPFVGPEPYVVVHPGASAAARTASAGWWARTVRSLALRGHRVVVTGGPDESALTRAVAGSAIDLGGRTTFAELAAVLRSAAVTVAPNTGAAHLSAAVGTPVVSLFAPIVPVERWGPYGIRSIVLGDQHAPCRGSRARRCDLAAHPCLDAIDPRDVGGAVEKLLRNSSLEREYPRVWKQGTTGILRSKPPTGSTCQAQFRNEES